MAIVLPPALGHLATAEEFLEFLRAVAASRDPGIHGHGVEVVVEAPRKKWWQALFNEEKDAIVIMKWKEALDFLEEATDRCEDVANIIEGVVLEHA